jgi:hypothetical protein
MDTATETMIPSEPELSQGETVLLPGQTPKGEYILSVLLKRTYNIVPDRPCIRAEEDRSIIPGDVPWGNPMNSSIRFESDFVPYKLSTDVVLNGKAYAPNGKPTAACTVAIKVANHRKDVYVIGDRKVHFVKNQTPTFSDPVPFTAMDLRYERAYGGIDVYSDKKTSYPYPRNLLGRGFIVCNTKEGIENLELPNLEDPKDLLTSDRLFVSEYTRWQDQPMPAGFGWFPKYWRPRAELAGIMPADRPVEQELRKAYSAFLPADQRSHYMKNQIPDMDFRFFNGASPGLVMPYLKGNEGIATANLSPEGVVSFFLPGDRPEIGLDIGAGLKQTEVVIHTVMIQMEERQVDIVWRGALPYPGPDWLVEMQKLEIIVT